jgi:indole-3-glycerol phosphate synthase
LKTLKELAEDAIDTVESGYYDTSPGTIFKSNPNLVQSIKSKSSHAIICEIKFGSPSAGKIDGRYDQVAKIAKEMEQGGAAGLSVLTEPKSFSGSVSNFVTARASTNLPLIMKDIIVSRKQIEAASRIGASAVLLIWELFSDGYSDLTIENAISSARERALEIVVETHSREGLHGAAKLDCDIIGINNRNLKTFKTSIETTIDLLGETALEESDLHGRPIMSESGFENARDITYVIEKLMSVNALLPRAFLIGTSIMKSSDVKSKVREFTELKLTAE